VCMLPCVSICRKIGVVSFSVLQRVAACQVGTPRTVRYPRRTVMARSSSRFLSIRYCSVLQCVAVCCRGLQFVVKCVAMVCNVLQCSAMNEVDAEDSDGSF